MSRIKFALLALACTLPMTFVGCKSHEAAPEAQPAPAPVAPAPEPTALSALQGEWTLVSFIKDGKTIAAGESMSRKLTITGQRYVLTGAKEIGNMPIGTISVDGAQKPKSITVVADPKDADGKVRFGVYDFPDSPDFLRIALAESGARKPDGFSPVKGQSILVFKRATAK